MRSEKSIGNFMLNHPLAQLKKAAMYVGCHDFSSLLLGLDIRLSSKYAELLVSKYLVFRILSKVKT